MDTTRLVFDKIEHMKALFTTLQQNTELFNDFVKFIHTRFTIKDHFQIGTMYRAFHTEHVFKSQIADINNNRYYFNAYYIDKYNEKSLKNFGPGFYTLSHI